MERFILTTGAKMFALEEEFLGKRAPYGLDSEGKRIALPKPKKPESSEAGVLVAVDEPAAPPAKYYPRMTAEGKRNFELMKQFFFEFMDPLDLDDLEEGDTYKWGIGVNESRSSWKEKNCCAAVLDHSQHSCQDLTTTSKIRRCASSW